MTFEKLGLCESIMRAVVSSGYTTPTPIQEKAIPDVMAGRDMLGCAQTGTGKTAAFALPILHRLIHAGNPPKGNGRRIRVLVLSPTRELAAQIGESFQTYGYHTAIRHTVIYGGVGQNPQVKALKHGVDILVATPGRLIDLMNQGYVDLGSLEIFVLDEADRMLDMGFMPDIKRIIAKLPAKRQTLLFSATMPEAIERFASSIQHDPVRVRITPLKPATELVEQSVCFVRQQEKPQILTDLLNMRAVTRALVFTRTKHGADRVAKQLNRSGIRADAIHGNKSQSARQRSLADFKSNRTRVLVATDVASRGIDVEGITHVLNYDMPHEPETYVHRIGRTGRAGASGIAVSLCDSGERKQLKAIERLIHQTLRVNKDIPQDAASIKPAKPAHSEAPDGNTQPHGKKSPHSHMPPRKKFGPKKRSFHSSGKPRKSHAGK